MKTISLAFCILHCALFTSPAATVTGTLNDIAIQGLNTKLMFAPTTNVLLTPTGLNAGPPKTIDVANGTFSQVLESGDYTVSLPLIPWRRPFVISVFPTNGTVNITNLLAGPLTYTYTTNNNWLLNDTSIYYMAGNVGIGTDVPSVPLEVNGPALVQSLALAGSASALNSDGSATFATGAATVAADGSATFLSGSVSIGASPLLHLQNSFSGDPPTQLLLENTDAGGVGLQLKSPDSTNNWQASLQADSFKIGKLGLSAYLTVNPAGQLSAPSGYAVGASIGITTNMLVITPGPKTNALVFTKGILTAVQ